MERRFVPPWALACPCWAQRYYLRLYTLRLFQQRLNMLLFGLYTRSKHLQGCTATQIWPNQAWTHNCISSELTKPGDKERLFIFRQPLIWDLSKCWSAADRWYVTQHKVCRWEVNLSTFIFIFNKSESAEQIYTGSVLCVSWLQRFWYELNLLYHWTIMWVCRRYEYSSGNCISVRKTHP